MHELIDDAGGDDDDSARLRATQAAYAGARFQREAPSGSRLAPIEQVDRRALRGCPSNPAPRPNVQWRYGPDGGRWPNPSRELYRFLLVLVDKSLLWGTTTWGVGMVLLGVAVTELFMAAVLGWYAPRWVRAETSVWGVIGAASFALICFSVYWAQLWFVVSALGVPALANWALSIPARRVLYGVVRTLVASPGTWPWEHLRDDVIALPIPAAVTTLTVPDDPAQVIELARAKTNERLPEILKAFGGKAAVRA